MKARLARHVRHLRGRAVYVGIIGLAALALLLHAWHYYPFMADDAFISLRYSQRLLEGHGLTWTTGERVEGYSNLLWVLGCAAIGALGVNLVIAARILGCICGVLTVAAVGYAFTPEEDDSTNLAPALVSMAVLASTGIMAVWTIGGLEQPLLAALLAWAHAIAFRTRKVVHEWSRRRTAVVGLLLGLSCLTRPDAVLFTGCLLVGLVVVAKLRRESFVAAVRIGRIPFALLLVQVLCRRAYYGEWMANTGFAKLGFSVGRSLVGWQYVRDAMGALTPAWFMAAPLLAALFLRADSIRRTLPLLGAALVWPTYIAVIGGDIFPAHRHMVPLVVVIAFFVGEATRFVTSLGILTRRAWNLASVAGCLWLTHEQYYDFDNQVAKYERWEWTAVPVGQMLQKEFESRAPVMAVDSAGSLVYFAHLPALDMLGLNDWNIAHHPPPWFGLGRPGHELGDGKYVLERKPDLVVFIFPVGSYGPIWCTGRQMEADPRFHQDYQYVELEAEGPSGLACRPWVRRDGRAGVVRDHRVTVPGYLLSGDSGTTARADSGGHMGTVIYRGHSAKFGRLQLEPRRWLLTAHSSGEPIRITAECGGIKPQSEGEQLTLETCGDKEGWSFTIETRGDGLSHVRDLTLVPE